MTLPSFHSRQPSEQHTFHLSDCKLVSRMFDGKSLFFVCILVLINIGQISSFNFNAKVMSLTTKRIAAAAIVAVGLTGLPDQMFSFSPNSFASAAETNSIFDGLYNDPNHPGCLVSFSWTYFLHTYKLHHIPPAPTADLICLNSFHCIFFSISYKRGKSRTKERLSHSKAPTTLTAPNPL